MAKEKILITITKDTIEKLDKIAAQSGCGRGVIIDALVANLTGEEIISLEIKKSYHIEKAQQVL